MKIFPFRYEYKTNIYYQRGRKSQLQITRRCHHIPASPAHYVTALHCRDSNLSQSRAHTHCRRRGNYTSVVQLQCGLRTIAELIADGGVRRLPWGRRRPLGQRRQAVWYRATAVCRSRIERCTTSVDRLITDVMWRDAPAVTAICIHYALTSMYDNVMIGGRGTARRRVWEFRGYP